MNEQRYLFILPRVYVYVNEILHAKRISDVKQTQKQGQRYPATLHQPHYTSHITPATLHQPPPGTLTEIATILISVKCLLIY